MANLNLRSFDDGLYHWLKVQAAERGYSLKELVTSILREVKRHHEGAEQNKNGQEKEP